MNSIRPTRWWPRYVAELAATGEAGIRDRETDVLHRAASIDDAHVDAEYLNAQFRAGNLPEVARHLAFVAEQARAGRPLRSAPAAPPDREGVLAAASEWATARLQADQADAQLARTRFLASLRRTLDAASAEAHLAAASVVDAVRHLYADPLAAQRVLSDTSVSVPLPELAALVRSEPTVFGTLAEPSPRRFGPAAAEEEVAARTERLARTLESQDSAASTLDAAVAAAAAAVQADPAASATDVSRALDERSRAETAPQTTDPRLHLVRATDRLRALLAAADEKTMAVVSQRFPDSATIAREARTHSSASLTRDF